MGNGIKLYFISRYDYIKVSSLKNLENGIKLYFISRLDYELVWGVCRYKVVTEIGNCQGLPLGDVINERGRNTSEVDLNGSERWMM